VLILIYETKFSFLFVILAFHKFLYIKGKVIRSRIISVGKSVGQTHSLRNSMKLNFLLKIKI
jgi:hypothetical protein